jgi:hypothetical protein
LQASVVLLYLQSNQFIIMLANNIWKLTGELFEWAFGPFEKLRLETNDSWWVSNGFNWVLVIIGLIAMVYWVSSMFSYKRQGKEDVA